MEYIVCSAAAAMIAVVCALMIKGKNPELSHVLAISAAIIISIGSISIISDISSFIHKIIVDSGLPSVVFIPLIKCTGIAMIAKVISELCKDAGQGGIAASVEYMGAAAALCTAFPLMKSMLDMLEGLT